MSQSIRLQLFMFVTNAGIFLAFIDAAFFQSRFALAFDFTDAKVIEEQSIFHISVSTACEASPEYINDVLEDDVHNNRLHLRQALDEDNKFSTYKEIINV